jgi:predicted XRE-type DNA-binding protein/predicted GIY-YIG superfamily endonuclease
VLSCERRGKGTRNRMFTVYRYKSPSKRFYIGITKFPDARKKQHAQKEWIFDDVTKFAKAIRKYGIEKMEYEIIETVETLAEACEREKYWIEFYDSIDSGYNMNPGGEYAGRVTYADRVVDDIRHLLLETKMTQKEIAKTFHVSESYVSSIKNGKMRVNNKVVRESRIQKGESVHTSKLKDNQVLEIKNKLAAGVSRSEIKKEYEISKTLVQMIATGQAWSHIQADYTYVRKEINGNAKLTVDVVKELKKDIALKNGSVEDIAKRYSISVATYYQIKRGKTWKDV